MRRKGWICLDYEGSLTPGGLVIYEGEHTQEEWLRLLQAKATSGLITIGHITPDLRWIPPSQITGLRVVYP